MNGKASVLEIAESFYRVASDAIFALLLTGQSDKVPNLGCQSVPMSPARASGVERIIAERFKRLSGGITGQITRRDVGDECVLIVSWRFPDSERK